MTIQIPANHTQCVVCQQPFFCDQPLSFRRVSDDTVQGQIYIANHVQGYNGVMQGGLITALHDAAMLHCLFARGIQAMTVKLETRFHHPIELGSRLDIEAQWLQSRRKVHTLKSQISVNGQVCSTAQSQFMNCGK